MKAERTYEWIEGTGKSIAAIFVPLQSKWKIHFCSQQLLTTPVFVSVVMFPLFLLSEAISESFLIPNGQTDNNK